MSSSRCCSTCVPPQPGARHSGVDLEVPVAARARPRLDHRGVAERGREIGAAQRVDLRAQDRREHHDRPRRCRRARSSSPFGDGRDAEAPRLELLERERGVQGAEAVAVGLHHRQQRHAGARRDGSPVADAARPSRPRPRRVSSGGAVRYHVKTEEDTDARRAMQEKPGLDETLALMRDLRDRCDWDAAQTHESLRPYLIEEAYEVDDAIRAGNDRAPARGARRPAAAGALPQRRRRGARRVRLRATWQKVSSRR